MRSAPSGLTVRRAIVAAVLLGVMLPAMLVGAHQARQLYRRLGESIDAVLTREASVVALGVRESLWALDVDSARTLVEAVADDPAVVSIEVQDLQHGRFAFAERAARRGVANVHSVEKVVSHRGEEIGRVRLEITEEPFLQQLRGQLLALGSTLLIQIVGSILLILAVLHKRISFPLQRLSQEAARLAHGDLNDPIVPLRHDEIGEVESQLEITRRALKGLIASLEQKNLALELDLHERTKVEEALRDSEQKFSSLFHLSPIPLALMRRADWTYLDVNSALAHELGVAAEDMIGTNSASLDFYADAGERQRLYAQLDRDGRVDDYEARLQKRDGSIIDCQIHLRILQMDEPCILAATVDISPLRSAQRKVEELNLSLEQRVVERTRALADANHELETAVERLRRTHTELVQSEKLAALGSLVAGIAHELNTPIGNSLMVASTLRDIGKDFRQGMAGGLKRSTLDNFVTETESAADIMVRNLVVAGELITSFKQVAVDQTSSQRRGFSLREVVREIVVTVQPTFRKTQYVIEEEIPEGIWLDSYPGPFGQVVTNLLNNTLLHAFDGRERGVVRLTAEIDDAFVIFRCADDGVGINPLHLNKIFDPFFTTKLGKRGTGLGLNIAHNIVTGVLGGEITVDSEPDFGTSFSLRMPLCAPRRGGSEVAGVEDNEIV
ncbi:ATP-binding protein [Uliginosibacterium sp. H3]|uniref:histidine kinase n=1 Tax=Uliginosibacterium silvisoli TaxID=3114758 RepID=A0ABU6JZ85_9RHOO|nr:ATP-binding protein [Uliginosibacterium sp. H3]